MPQASMPAAVEVYFKLRTQRMQEVRLGTICSQPDQDSDSVLVGIQNEAELAIDFDPANEKYDLFYRSVNESGVGKVISIKRAFINTTLSGALNAATTAFNLVPPANTDSFKVGSIIEIESELMVLLTWNSGTGAATVEERGAHGTEATAHADSTEIAKMIYTVPHNSIVLSGNLDSSLPLAPTTLVVANVVGAIGNGLSISIGLPTSQIKSLFRVHIQASTVLWPEDFENTTGTIGIQATGADGAITQGGTALTTSVTLDTGWAGKLIHTYESINLLTGEVSAPDILRISTVVDNGDGTWTVNISGDNVYNLRRGALGVAGVVNWTIVDDFRTPGNPSTNIENIKPLFNQGAARGDPDVLAVQHILFTAETVFVRARLRNFEGYGPWMYHNGASGTTTRLSATTFTPGHMQGPAIEPGTIGETEIADNSITAKLLTENAMNFNTDLVFSADDADTVSWGSGTIEFADGSTFSIVSGNTGNMTGLVFIYFDPGASGTELQVTTNRATAVGDRKQIISVAKPAGIVGEDAFFAPVFGVFGINGSNIGPNSIREVSISDNAISTPKLQANSVDANKIQANSISADKIQANAISADKLQANSVTALKINVVTLSAINQDVGTIIAGNITGVIITGGTIRTASSGQRVQMLDSLPDRIGWTNSSGTERARIELETSDRLRIFCQGDVKIRADGSTDFDFSNIGFSLFGSDINQAGDISLDSLTKDGGGSIAVNDNFDMNSNDILECAQITPVSNNSGAVGTAALTFNTGHILNIICGSFTADNGTNIVVDDHLDPNIDNTYRLGTAGKRYSDLRSVLINGADIGLENKWKMREWPCTYKDVQTKSVEWMQENANLGMQFLDDDENVIAVLHKNGYLYCKGVKPLEELPA